MLVSLYIFSVYFYVLMEWIFFVTKPSFFSAASACDRISSLLIPPLLPALLGIAGIFVVWGMGRLFRSFASEGFFFAIACVISSAVISASVFMLVDNFTYTMFGFGVVSSKGLWCFCYAALFLLLLFSFSRLFFKITGALRSAALFSGLLSVSIILVALSAGAAAYVYAAGNIEGSSLHHDSSRVRQPVNVLILSSDALNARHLSAYGYKRDTTPFLREFMKEALVCENCFTNCAHSGGSLAALFTGKLPTTTKLVYPPDILRGKDACQHFPGILGDLGYHRFDISERHYADPYDLNLRNSFDVANFRTIKKTSVDILPRAIVECFGLQVYFLTQMFDRAESRLLHSFGLKKMVNVFEEVTQKDGIVVHDDERVKAALDFIDREGTPFLVHMHLMGTHGSKYAPRNRVFSKGEIQSEEWMDNFYDDSILDFDGYVREIVGYLRGKGLLDNTVVVIHTDHGKKWVTNERLPLIIRFPNGEHRGHITANVQYMDVAPTIIDYLGLEIPSWMEGQSLLSGDMDPLRPIIAVSAKYMEKVKKGCWAKPASLSPIEGLGTISVIFCQRYFMINFWTEKWPNRFSSCIIKGHTAPCDEKCIPSRPEMREFLIEHLRKKGFDLSLVDIPPLEK